MKFSLLFILLFCLRSIAADLALPAINQGHWTPGTAAGTPGVGIPGGVFQYLAGGVNDRAVTGTLVNMTLAPHNCDPTGIVACDTALAAAIAAASGPTVLYFPAGQYLFTVGGFYFNGKDEVTIRGAGPGVTVFLNNAPGGFMLFGPPGSPNIRESPNALTGTKTKGSTTFTPALYPYLAGSLVVIAYENETNNARIIAGSPPVWSSGGFPWSRTYVAMVTGYTTGPDTVSIDPPLPADGTNLDMRFEYVEIDQSNYCGLEDFTLRFGTATSNTSGVGANLSKYCWFYNIFFQDWSRDTDAGSALGISASYRCEVRKCKFTAVPGASSDGALGTGGMTSCLIEDNIFRGSWGYVMYDGGGSVNNVVGYNYAEDSDLQALHNTHPSHWLFEGNVGATVQFDGYHGSASNNTIYRNLLFAQRPVVINRFNRQHFIAGNALGWDGINTALISWGNPNISNGSARGFSGPSGTSTQVGAIDYLQPGYAPDTYVIQPSDIAVGDFSRDWEVTGELITRTGDAEATFLMSGGWWQTGSVDTAGGNLVITAYHGASGTSTGGTVQSVSGLTVHLTFANGVLPTVGSTVRFYFGAAGWQERDLDVQATSWEIHNYFGLASGTGALTNTTADTLPNSLYYSAKPAWFGSLTWPPVNPNSPTFNREIIPAGYRYFNSDNNPPTTGSNPVITITSPASPPTIAAGASQAFTATATDTEDGSLTGASIVWRNGATTIGTGTSITPTFSTAGTFTIYATATDSDDNQDSDSMVVTVTSVGSNPVATITSPASPPTISAGTTQAFTATATDADDGSLSGASVVWKIGGTTIGTGLTLDHLFSAAGSFTVTVTATDSNSNTHTDDILVTVTGGGGGGGSSSITTGTLNVTTLNVGP